jgi:hypothetical protein
MQCRYREKILVCGDWIYGEVHPTWRPAGKRRGKFRETSEVQQKLNDRRAEIWLSAVAHANFTSRDYALHMTWTDGNLPADAEGIEKDIRNFMARLRRLYRNRQAELKYIIVRSWSGKGRPHLHLILSGGIPREEIERCWKMGRANCDRLEFTETGIADLSAYIGGQRKRGKTDAAHVRRKGERRWSGSRNLEKPVEKSNMTRYSKAALEEIADAGNPHKIFADRYPKYWLAEYPEIRQNPVTHGWELSFMLYRPDSPDLAPYARKDRKGVRSVG